MKRYVFQIIIEEGNDEFWESLVEENRTGCEDVQDLILESFAGCGLADAEVTLVEYTNK
jgi:hypothetical protein